MTPYRLNRRAFITGSAAAAGAALFPGWASAVPRPTDDPVRMGVIGLGRQGAGHVVRALHSTDACRLVAACDLWAPRRAWAAEFGVETTSDWQALLQRDDLDAVIIATPDHWHAPMVMEALDAGTHVFVEAPLALTASEARAIADRARATGAVLQVGRLCASHAMCARARQTLEGGDLGPLQWIQAHMTLEPDTGAQAAHRAGLPSIDALDWTAFAGPAHGIDAQPAHFDRWHRHRAYVGAFPAGGFVEALAPILLASGCRYPVRASAAGGAYEAGRETPDSLVVRLEYPGGIQVVLTTAPVRGHEANTVFRTAQGEIRFTNGGIAVHRHGMPDTSSFAPATMTTASAGEQDTVGQWLAAIQHNAACACDGELAHAITVAQEMAAQAYDRSTG